MLATMEFFSYYLYNGHSLYAESEEGLFHYDYADKKWYPVEDSWDLTEASGMAEISAERAAHFL